MGEETGERQEYSERKLELAPYFTHGRDACSLFKWKTVASEIKNTDGEVIFSRTVEVPEQWGSLATKVVASKYLYKGAEHQENSAKDLVSRVSDAIGKAAAEQGMLEEDYLKNFIQELRFITAGQYGSFNSPVWFNVGLFNSYGVRENRNPAEKPSHWAFDFKTGEVTHDVDAYERAQASACFIQSINDNMQDILEHARKEGMLFKYGSGTGTNFSTLRGTYEPLSGGGVASGMPSFMRIFDIIAGRIQSGGKTRRAAKMVICNCDHPDILRFVQWKVNEERKALWLCANPEWAPTDPSDLESEAYKTVDGQNGNNSVRVTDKFMKAVEAGDDWELRFLTADKAKEESPISLDKYKDDRYLSDKRFLQRVTNKRKVIKAKDLWELIARAAYVVGDPAVQYDDNINKWHTCKNSGRINASNPCSEFMFVDNSACNLASLNLMKFLNPNGSFDIEGFKHAVRTMILAQDVLVDYASYPSSEMAENSHKFRPLGLGYTNLGAVLMSQGIAYDSAEGRAIASAITALMTGTAYEASSELAAKFGAFKEFEKNKEPMLEVMSMHKECLDKVDGRMVPGKLESILAEAKKTWERVIENGKRYGFRNAQTTLLAPTGTIGFMMDVDCTGVEPMPALTSVKGLAGGGKLDMEIKPCVRKGLETVGYRKEDTETILEYIKEYNTVRGCPIVREEHQKVFATALEKKNPIGIDGHLGMMAAVQPFLSGAVSKTVNLPRGATIEDVKGTYEKGWRLGLKSISLYVDGSKGVQPINVEHKEESKLPKWGSRIKPPNPTERWGVNANIGGTGVHIIFGEHKDKKPSECIADIFVAFGSSGSQQSAAYESWSKEASRNLQRGSSVREFIKHNLGANGVINGLTNHPLIKQCSSIEDFAARLIMLEYLGLTEHLNLEEGKELSPEDIANLRCNILARRNRVEHASSRIRFIDSVMGEGKVTEIKPLLEDEVKKDAIKPGSRYCRNCGHALTISGANCYKCTNCAEAPECG